MKRLLAITAVLGLLAVGESGAEPRLVIKNNAFDFGIAPQQSTLVTKFWFKAAGTDTVRIDRIVTGCQCVATPIVGEFLAPGDSALVEFAWNTERSIGPTGRYPYILHDSLKDPERVLLKGTITPTPDSARPVWLKPFRAEFPFIKGIVSADSVTFMIMNAGTATAVISIVSEVPEEFSVHVPDSVVAGGQGTGCVKLLPGRGDKELLRSVTIEYKSDPDVSGRLSLPIRRKIYGN